MLWKLHKKSQDRKMKELGRQLQSLREGRMTDKERGREMKRNVYKGQRAHSIIKERKHIRKRPVNAENFFLVTPPF